MRILSVTALVLLAVAAAPASAQVYKWTDASGRVHYSDQPVGDNAKQIRPPTPPAASGPAVPASQNPPRVGADSSLSPANATREQAQAVQRDVAKVRADQCKQATGDYEKAVQAMRLFKLNDKGEREYMSAAEIDATRVRLRAERDTACGS
jgi:hypothetical protein